MSVVVAMGKFTEVQTEYAIKDNLPRGATKVTAQIIVGTPGTMTDLIRRKVIDASEVKVFVLDEADNMLDQDGLGDQTLRVKKFVLMLITSPVILPSFHSPYKLTVCSLAHTRYRLCSFQPPSRKMSALLQISLPQMRTKSNSRGMSFQLITSANSTWIAETQSTNTKSSCPSIVY